MSAPLLEPPATPARRRAWPPGLRLLLGPGAGAVVDAALMRSGARLVGLRAMGASVQPSGAATVRYAAEIVRPDGRRTRGTVAAATGTRIPSGATVVEVGATGERLAAGVWRWPADPALPALAWAGRAAGAAGRLSALGLADGPVHLRVRSYRPGRRAVIEATTGTGVLFLKVVRPGAVHRLVERHAVLQGAVPVPPVLAATADGAVVLPGWPGTPMRALVAAGGQGLPAPSALEAVLDALPAAAARVAPAGRGRPGEALSRAGDHAAVLTAMAPDLRRRLDRLVAVLRSADRGQHAEVPVHGDFYESQLLVDAGSVVGLLDVDTLGRGHRIDDWATLLGHLVLLGAILPAPGAALGYAAAVEEAALARWPATQLRPRVAAVLLGLAPGPFRVLQEDWAARTEQRIALAERWAAPTSRAHRVVFPRSLIRPTAEVLRAKSAGQSGTRV